MTRWNTIPSAQQKPGKLMGGFWVVIQAYAIANQWTVALLGPDGAKVTAGYGGWNQITMPRHIGITEFGSPANLEMDLDLIYDGWFVHPVLPHLPASFHRPPKLPHGVKFQSPQTGRPIGMVTRMKTRRPLPAPPSRPGHLKHSKSAVFGKKGGAHGRALEAPQTREPPPMRRQNQRPRGLWIESALDSLESFATRQQGDTTPHSVRLYGAVPHTEKRWIVTGLDWGDAIRDEATGRRRRQEVTVHLMEYHDPAALRTLPRGKAQGSSNKKKKAQPRAKPVQVPGGGN
jgi:hypothetical protein